MIKRINKRENLKMKTTIISIIFILFVSGQLFSQQYLEKKLQGYNNPEEQVTLSSSLTFSQAIKLISKVSEKTTGRKVFSTADVDTAIGIEINDMNYLQALKIITKMAGLVYQQTPDAIVVKSQSQMNEKKKSDSYVPVNAREVRISAVFFESDVNKAKQLGIDWQTLFTKGGLQLGSKLGDLSTQQFPGTGSTSTTSSSSSSSSSSGGTGSSSSSSNTASPEFGVGVTSNFNVGSFFGQATAIFRMLESENVGNIIASPNITVLDGTQARLQDGQDLAIKQRDFSGNIIENFYSIGSIVTVTPHVLKEDGVNYILLNIHVERSSFVPDPNNTIINKTSANTKVVMLNGEETVIGGMFINQTTKIRTGIPFLKDLPWWVFGLRYIFGSDQTSVIKKELVILIKADLVPTLKERLAGPQSTTPLKDELKHQREKIKYYQFNNSQSNQ